MQLDHVLIKVTVKCWPTPEEKNRRQRFSNRPARRF